MTKGLSDCGDWVETDSVSVFFGNKDSQVKTSHVNILFGHQVHRDDLVEVHSFSSGSAHLLTDSDGLWTSKKNLKLGVYTADCVPCFIYNNNKLFALHLGWRSLHLGLLEKALKNIDPSTETQIFIGPHIQEDSFEVGEDVLKKFQVLMPRSKTPDWFIGLSNKKFKVSLKKIILYKMRAFNIMVFSSEIDTLTSKTHCSYRRRNQTQVQSKGRNISFAFLK